MNNDQNTINVSKKENIAFYVFLITVILAPLAFFWSKFQVLDNIKTFIIATGTIVSAILLAYNALKTKSVTLLPKSICMTSVLLVVSIIISSLLSLHISKSFFGYGFEISNASFILLMFLTVCVVFQFITRSRDRSIILYFGFISSYLVLFIIHLLRVILGKEFMGLGIMDGLTTTIFGTWFGLASFSSIILFISYFAIQYLDLKGKMKIANYVLLALSTVAVVLVADTRVWFVLLLSFAVILILSFIAKFKANRSSGITPFIALSRSVAIMPLIAVVLSLYLVVWGPKTFAPVVTKLGIENPEVFLPWQTTLDVTSSVIQNYPLFGVGSNNFTQAYNVYKPASINLSPAWSNEFSHGVGLIPTFVSIHGIVGSILWILLFVFYGIISVKVISRLPQEKDKKFLLVSSFTSGTFLWILAFVTVPSHVILFFTAIILSMFLALATSYGLIPSRVYAPVSGTKMHKMFGLFASLAILVLVVWALVYIKTIIANSYVSKSLRLINESSLEDADATLNMGLKLEKNDFLWRAKAELSIAVAQKLASNINSNMSASTTQAVINQIADVLNAGAMASTKAIEYDPTNYYNYVSQARVAEIAASAKLPKAYESAVAAYSSAIRLNPLNPILYYSLAGLEAKNGKYDDSLKNLGMALQVKNNYLDAVFLLSQVYASKGDLQNAITAAALATQLNPQNSVLWFQNGLLRYNARDFAGATEAFTLAVKYQPDYANAKYFLGLSLARLGNIPQAIAQFEDLEKTNKDNQEIALILANLRSGKSLFNEVKASTPAPEKRSTLPLKEKEKKQ